MTVAEINAEVARAWASFLVQWVERATSPVAPDVVAFAKEAFRCGYLSAKAGK